MSATIGGVGWTATTELTAVNQSGIYSVAGSSIPPGNGIGNGTGSGVSMLFEGEGLAVAGKTYPVNTTLGLLVALVINSRRADGRLAQALYQATSGTVTISTLTSTSTSGTFSFVATVGSLSQVVTNGTFNVKF